MTTTPSIRQKIVLRVAPKRIDRVCEQIVTQLALHVLLNKSRVCQGTARSGEVETALRRLTALGIVCSLELQVDNNIVTYHFLRRYSDIVAQVFKRRVEIIKEYQALMRTAEDGVSAGEVVTYEQEQPQPPPDDLSYINLHDFMKREIIPS